MGRSFKRAIVLASVGLALFGRTVFGYLSDTSVHTPPSYNSFVPPGKGGSYNDQVYGTAIKRLSNAINTTDASIGSGTLEFITNEYSTMSPFNEGATRLLLQHYSYFALYDGNGNYVKDLLDLPASSEPRWSRSDPDLLYFLSGNKLKKLNVASGAVTLVRSFGEYGQVRGNGESDICFDGDHFVLVGDDRYVFVYEISTNTKGAVLDVGSRHFDSVYITPDDNVTITWATSGTTRYRGIELFDRNMNFLRQVTRAGGHMDVTRDTNGDEVLVWASAADPTPLCDNGVVKVRLSDGKQTCLLTTPWGVGYHVSAPDDNGWALVSTYNPDNPAPSGSWCVYENEVFYVRLDGSETRRLAHHRSRPFDGYYYMARAATDRQGKKAVFSSNHGLQTKLSGYPTQYTDTYLMTLPTAGTPPAPSPSPTPTPDPDPTPEPTPAPSDMVTYQEDAPEVSYVGTWSTNTNAVHSGGAAKLSMEKGARVTINFTGTAIRWVSYKDQWAGMARIRVDGELVKVVDTYASPEDPQAVVYRVRGLKRGAHRLTVTVTGTKCAASGGKWVWLDAFRVTP